MPSARLAIGAANYRCGIILPCTHKTRQTVSALIRLSRETMGEVPHGIPRPDNANYLWIQLFHSTLNETGRAGFVMANSAATRGAASR